MKMQTTKVEQADLRAIWVHKQYNLSNPACYQTEKKFRITQGTGIERLTYPRDIKVTLVSIGIQHMVDKGSVNDKFASFILKEYTIDIH